MKPWIKFSGCLWLWVLLVVSPAAGQTLPRAQTFAQSYHEALERWQRMTPEQKQVAHALIAAGLSQRGYMKAATIMRKASGTWPTE